MQILTQSYNCIVFTSVIFMVPISGILIVLRSKDSLTHGMFPLLFDLPRETHRYFIEQISGAQHIKTIFCSSFVQFVQSLDKCEKLSIRLLVNLSKNDFNTVLCKNLHSIARDCNMNIDNLDKFVVKQNVKYFKTPAGVEWKILLLKELLDIRNMCNLLDEFEDHEISDMINFLCTD